MQYWYFHGFASGPTSQKAVFFQQQMQALGLTLHLPDLNLEDFSQISLSRQLAFLGQQLQAVEEPLTLIGSSLGGLLAALYAERDQRVAQLVLLAPAFEFAQRWQTRLGAAAVAQWREQGIHEVFHYAQRRPLPLRYGFLEDALTHTQASPQRPVPTLIIHGRQDAVIDYSVSVAYAAPRPWVDLKLIESDHALTDALPLLWDLSGQFLGLTSTAPA